MAEPSIDELFERIKALVSETRYRLAFDASASDWVAEYDRVAGVHEELENAWSSIYLAVDGPRWAVAAVFVASMHHSRLKFDMLVRRDEERKRAMHREGRWI